MTKLTDLTRGIVGHAAEGDAQDEADEYEVCPVCGEAFDRRLLQEAMYHFESDNHERLHTWH
ncbi:hypothetical protein GCM10011487_12040 [Steroidobacter agaridevorans]|uniref:Uncharacterized protein n=1 Tax=Steroidobacter agaridevorans TaxID=2695856 RepID=A0A829Y7F9_9GAMM|nr:hypothetical protein GCM10011487_12040 [Steroidobacter agaridevorans]